MFKDLIKYEGLEECSHELFGFSNVTLLRDFGPLKKDTKILNIWFNLVESTVTTYDSDGVMINNFPFRLEA